MPFKEKVLQGQGKAPTFTDIAPEYNLVAASGTDVPLIAKRRAGKNVCDGVNDEVELNAALE